MNENKAATPQASPGVSLSFLLSQLGTHAAQTFAGVLEPLGLRVQDAGLLRMLSVRPGVTQVELSETFGILPSRMVVLLDGLEAAGLVERARDASDRRRMRVQLSAKGSETAKAIAAMTAEMDQGLFRALAAHERAELERLLRKLIQDQSLQAGVHPAFRSLAGGATTNE